MRKYLGLTLTTILLSTSALAARNNSTPLTINKIIVFGDSLSDVGNDYRKTNPIHEILKYVPSFAKYFPTGAIPSTTHHPYNHGRFSNGKVWAEDLANTFGIQKTDINQNFKNGAFQDYAYGGSLAYPYIQKLSKFPAPLPKQIQEYVNLHKFRVATNRASNYQPNTLAIIFIGSNDYFYLPDSSSITGVPERVLNAQKSAIKTLYTNGIRNFLVLGVPNIAETPLAQHNSITRPNYASRMYIMSSVHDALAPMYMGVFQTNKSYPGLNIMYYGGVNSLLDKIIKNPESFGFIYGIKKPCYTFYPDTKQVASFLNKSKQQLMKLEVQNKNAITNKLQFTDNVCADNKSKPNQHVFFDQVHPTRIIHCILANMVCNYLRKEGVQSSNGALQCNATSKQAAAQACRKMDKKGDLNPV